MTNKLVIIINNLKIPKIKKTLLFEMKFLVPNYNCLQNPWLGGYRPQIPVLSVLCPQLNLLNPPRRTKFLGTPLLPSTQVFWDVRLCIGSALTGVSKGHNIFIFRVRRSKNRQLDPVDEDITLLRKGSNYLSTWRSVSRTLIFTNKTRFKCPLHVAHV